MVDYATAASVGTPGTRSALDKDTMSVRLRQVAETMIQAHQLLGALEETLGFGSQPASANPPPPTPMGMNGLTPELRGLAAGLRERLERLTAAV